MTSHQDQTSRLRRLTDLLELEFNSARTFRSAMVSGEAFQFRANNWRRP